MMKTRFFKSWRTSILGLVILTLGAVLAILGRATWEAFLLTVPIAAALIYTKDPARYLKR